MLLQVEADGGAGAAGAAQAEDGPRRAAVEEHHQAVPSCAFRLARQVVGVGVVEGSVHRQLRTIGSLEDLSGEVRRRQLRPDVGHHRRAGLRLAVLVVVARVEVPSVLAPMGLEQGLN